jgi:hypothetical protein
MGWSPDDVGKPTDGRFIGSRPATPAERRFWSGIRREQIEGFKFRRQVVLFGFIVDFARHEARLVLEVDGASQLPSLATLPPLCYAWPEGVSA